jgi:hypothetical protein
MVANILKYAFYFFCYYVEICYELGSLDIMNMVATLGSGECGGSVYIMDFSEIIDSSAGSWNINTRNRRVASLDRTVWAADCNSDSTRAAFGKLILGLNCRLDYSQNFYSR